MGNTNLLTYQSLISQIRDGVLVELKKFEKLSKTAEWIRIEAKPCTKEADNFFGGLGRFGRRVKNGINCVSLPDYPTTYGFFIPLKATSGSGVETASSDFEQVVSVWVQKKKPLNRLDESEGMVAVYKDWCYFNIGVLGLKEGNVGLNSVTISTEIIRQFFDGMPGEWVVKGFERVK